MKINIVLSVLITFTVCPMAHAVSPAPDGGYPGGNTAEGQNALSSLTTGTYNTAVGLLSLGSNTEGQFNTAIGAGALLANVGDPSVVHGVENTATGAGALLSNSTGADNTANGAFALFHNIKSGQNTADGALALFNNTGAGNTAVGQSALHNNTTGNFNTAVGNGALAFAGGSSNTAVGSGAGQSVLNANNVICIGQGVLGGDVSDSCYIGNIWNQPGGSQAVYVNSDGKLGFATSSRRFKDDIKPMAQASEVIYALKPVSFRFKPEIEPMRPRGFGLIAEEVEKLSPDLVTRGADGKVNSVRYDQVNAMLLNEFLKEHSKVQELEATITKQNKGMVVLTAQLKEQAAEIQKVSAQLEMSKFTKKVVLNNP
jgi:trimeric autotransporter adhesin